MSDPKPRLDGYSAAYRVKLEEEFLGPIERRRMGRAPAWVREVFSKMLKEIENSHAEIATGLARFTDAEINAEFKRRNPPPPNPQAPAMKEPGVLNRCGWCDMPFGNHREGDNACPIPPAIYGGQWLWDSRTFKSRVPAQGPVQEVSPK